MGQRLRNIIMVYYKANRKDAGDLPDDAFNAMEEFEKLVVKEIIQEHAEEVSQQEAIAREEQLRKVHQEAVARSMRSFTGMIVEAVVLATIVGLIGSHLYGLGEAWWYAPNAEFMSRNSILALVLLTFVCLALIAYMFMKSLPEWVEDAIRRPHER